MGTMLAMSLRQVTDRNRLAAIVLLALLPVGVAFLLHTFVGDERDFVRDFTRVVVDGLLIGLILPIVVMVLATAAFGNELEDRTLNVLVLKPISRFSIAFPKYAASVIVSGVILGGAAVSIVLIALGDRGAIAVVAATAAVLTGVLAYSSAFTWMGLKTTKALAIALLYVFVWEQLLTRFISGIRYFSIREYCVAILQGIDDDTYRFSNAIEFEAGVIGAAVVTVLFVWLTVRRLRTMDVQ